MQFVEIYRSSKLRRCEQRAFVLLAVGIKTEILPQPDGFTLWVGVDDFSAAQRHLELYEAENKPTRPIAPLRLHKNAAIAPIIYAATLVAVAYLAGERFLDFDWYDAGALRPWAALHDEWHRIFTALTLHADELHLLGNLGFGAYFCYLAARFLNWGVALGAGLFAAAAANLLNVFLMPTSHSSIGASTMVFAWLGIIAAFTWRRQFDPRLRWSHRWAPIIAGVMLLGLIGSGESTPNGAPIPGGTTDVLAHLTGFACGAVAGAVLARAEAGHIEAGHADFDRIKTQIAGCAAMLLALAGAWYFAIP